MRPEVAAIRNGVGKRTYYDWKSRASSANAAQGYRDFADALEVALADWEASDVLLIGLAARQRLDGEWQAAAWRLERRLPEVYGRRTRVDGDVSVTAKPMLDPSKLTLNEMQTLGALLRKAAPSEDELPARTRPAHELMPGLAES